MKTQTILLILFSCLIGSLKANTGPGTKNDGTRYELIKESSDKNQKNYSIKQLKFN